MPFTKDELRCPECGQSRTAEARIQEVQAGYEQCVDKRLELETRNRDLEASLRAMVDGISEIRRAADPGRISIVRNAKRLLG